MSSTRAIQRAKNKKVRFKIACEGGRECYVYATDLLQATQIFNDNKPTHDLKGKPLTLLVATVEVDTGEWKTHLQDGRLVFG